MQTILITVVFMLNIAQADSSDFEIATKKKEDRVVVTKADGKNIVIVRSCSGIGAADVTRLKERWPDTVVIRLHLGGLECFAVTSGKVRLTTSVASHHRRAKRLQVDQDGTESDVEKGNPFWTEVKVLGADGKPSPDYPLRGGHFEIALPAVLLRDQPKTITLAWIDFYRG